MSIAYESAGQQNHHSSMRESQHLGSFVGLQFASNSNCLSPNINNNPVNTRTYQLESGHIFNRKSRPCQLINSYFDNKLKQMKIEELKTTNSNQAAKARQMEIEALKNRQETMKIVTAH